MTDPLDFFYELGLFNELEIARVAAGEKFLAVMLKNGHIGVCATLGNKVSEKFQPGVKDLKKPASRIFYNACLNALVNYTNTFHRSKDIFDEIDFRKYNKTVMIGFFESLHKKFREAGIAADVFDLEKKEAGILPPSMKNMKLQQADAVILTATSVFNGTFNSVMGAVNKEADVLLLGPSAILDMRMFRYAGIRYIFGAVFEKYDEQLLEVIEKGGGTMEFLPMMRKVYLKRVDLT